MSVADEISEPKNEINQMFYNINEYDFFTIYLPIRHMIIGYNVSRPTLGTVLHKGYPAIHCRSGCMPTYLFIK